MNPAGGTMPSLCATGMGGEGGEDACGGDACAQGECREAGRRQTFAVPEAEGTHRSPGDV